MTVQEIMQGIQTDNNISVVGDVKIDQLCFDSRKAAPGTMFFCIPGETTDGHLYAAKAAEQGASVIVAEHLTDAKAPHILVKNSRSALFYACANFFGHPEKQLKFIGVTGTNGKTSTTFFIKELLDAMGIKAGLLGTVRNMIGQEILPSGFTTPEPLQLFELFAKMRDAQVEYVVMEISSHALCQDRVAGLEFEVGVFTNLTQDHLDFHKTMEAYKGLSTEEQHLYCLYGGLLLQKQHPVLKTYLQKEEKQYLEIYENLKKQPFSEKIAKRLSEVEQILKDNRKAYCYFRE